MPREGKSSPASIVAPLYYSFRGLEDAPHGTQNVQRERQNGAEKLDDSLEVRGWVWLEAAQGPRPRESHSYSDGEYGGVVYMFRL